MSLFKKFATVASGTMTSRLLGFMREILMAMTVGTGPVADAFNAAFRFPNTFRRLFAEGAFSSAFVPLFSKRVEQTGMESARKFTEEVFSVLFFILLFVTILMEFSMPFLVRYVIAPGFSDDATKFDSTIRFAVVMFPYLACMSLSAMMAGILNSLHRYFAAAAAPACLNVILIAILLCARMMQLDVWHIGYALSWGVMASGFVQLAIVAFAVYKAGIKIRLIRPRFTKDVRHLLWLAFPAAITGGITQINLLINTNIASSQSGAVSSLVYADRLYQLPLGVVGIAVATVLLPELSRALRAGNQKEADNLQNRSVEFTLFLTLPAAAAFLVMAEPLVRLLFERGQFSAQSTHAVAGLLAIYGFGLPAFVLIKAFIPGFFAREDTKTPMIFAAISVLVNVSIALSLFPHLSARGIAIAEITAAWINAALLFFTLLKRGHWSRDDALLKRIPKLFLASAVMAVALHFACLWLAAPLAAGSPFMIKAATIIVLILVAMVIYFGTTFLIGGASLAMVKRGLTRKKG